MAWTVNLLRPSSDKEAMDPTIKILRQTIVQNEVAKMGSVHTVPAHIAHMHIMSGNTKYGEDAPKNRAIGANDSVSIPKKGPEIMAVETDTMRLEYPKDFGVSGCMFTDVSARTNASTYSMLRDKYQEEEAGGKVGVESSAPFALVRTSDVPNVVQGDTIAISGTTFTIWAVEPDGEGMPDLRLRV